MKYPFLLFLFLSMMVLGQAPSNTGWFKVADNSAATSVRFPSAATYRYGTSTGVTPDGKDCSKVSCWATVSVTAGASIANVQSLPDPAPGLAKELDVYQTAVTQTVVVNGNNVSVPAKGAVQTFNISCTGTGTLDSSGNLTSNNLNCVGTKQ